MLLFFMLLLCGGLQAVGPSPHEPGSYLCIVSHACRTKLLLEWDASPVNDMLADSIVALAAQAQTRRVLTSAVQLLPFVLYLLFFCFLLFMCSIDNRAVKFLVLV